MDTNKWKSIAVRIEDYNLLKGICKEKFRAPGAMISVSYTHLTLPTKRIV